MKYNIAMRAIHWAMSLMIFSLLIVGWYMVYLPSDAPNKYDYYPLHKAFGMIVLLLSILRLVVRTLSRLPDNPKIDKNALLLSKAVISALYVLMALVPICGYLMSVLSGRAVDVFGFAVPSLFEANSLYAGYFHEAHSVLAYTLLALVLLHLAGWAKHLIKDKVNLLERMM